MKRYDPDPQFWPEFAKVAAFFSVGAAALVAVVFALACVTGDPTVKDKPLTDPEDPYRKAFVGLRQADLDINFAGDIAYSAWKTHHVINAGEYLRINEKVIDATRLVIGARGATLVAYEQRAALGASGAQGKIDAALVALAALEALTAAFPQEE